MSRGKNQISRNKNTLLKAGRTANGNLPQQFDQPLQIEYKPRDQHKDFDFILNLDQNGLHCYLDARKVKDDMHWESFTLKADLDRKELQDEFIKSVESGNYYLEQLIGDVKISMRSRGSYASFALVRDITVDSQVFGQRKEIRLSSQQLMKIAKTLKEIRQ